MASLPQALAFVTSLGTFRWGKKRRRDSEASNSACLPIASHQSLEILPSEVFPHDEPCVAVVGVGYVGTCLVASFSSAYRVIGFDISERQINKLRGEFSDRSRVSFTTRGDDLKEASHFLISVPTPLRPDKTVDLSCLQNALETVSMHARRGTTVVIESSLAVGTTRRLLGPICSSRGLFGGISPEVCPAVKQNTPLLDRD